MDAPDHRKPEPHGVEIEHLEVPVADLIGAPVHSIDHGLKPWIARHCRIRDDEVISYRIQRRSLDARRKPDLRLVYHLRAVVAGTAVVHESDGTTVSVAQGDRGEEDAGLEQLNVRPEGLPLHPIVVGTGPAGIMAAYLLARYGCRPLILDRGRDADRRTADLERFHQERHLDPDSNFLFGEGGAGTYSDGKLYTRVKDRRMRFLLEAFVAARAPRHLLYRHHPHIGSDLLPHMAKRLRRQIIDWGGEFRWQALVTGPVITDQGQGPRCTGVRLADGETIPAPLVLIAPGHSARDLIRTLIGLGIDHRAKGFQLGCRIEHDQRLIDLGQYGREVPRHLLHAAEYNLVSRPPPRCHAESVTTFCMCPGGEIIAATSDEGRLSTNGMSRFARASPFANAGLIVNQPIDRDSSGMAGFDLIERLEMDAFAAGGGDYTCPAQSADGFLKGTAGGAVKGSSYRLGVRPGRIDALLPGPTVAAVRQALIHFDRIIPGFIRTGVIVGVETRVSSPVRFERDPGTLESSLPGLYLAGEGAGYAGGIVSAGLDGLRLAETIITGVPAHRER